MRSILLYRRSFQARSLASSLVLSATLLVPIAVRAQFAPVLLTPDSFNQDVVVESTAPRPAMPATTASVEAGVTNTGFSWFEKGYNADNPAAGLPAPGFVTSSELTMDHEFQFPPDYRTNNAVLIDPALTHAELRFVSPAAFAGLSFLLSGAHDSMSAPIALVVHHQDGTVETATIRCQDWLNTMAPAAYTAYGRVEVTVFTFANINAGIPRLFSADIALTNTASAITSIEFSYVSGPGHSVVMALSGAAEAGGTFTPVAVSGFNADVVVEAGAVRAQALLGVTTATMADGAGNRFWTWHERGYVPGYPNSGLPPTGALLTNTTSPDRVYQMPASYAASNVALVDADSPSIHLTPASPDSYRVLSLLTAAAGGRTTNDCVVQHADGSSQTNSLVSPDWADETIPAAFNAAGRVNINNRLLGNLDGSGPRLFAAELSISNATSPITNIQVNWRPGTTTAHTVFFAVSGRTAATPPAPATLSIQIEVGGNLRIQSSAPGQLEYTARLEGADTVWHSLGTITDTLSIAPVPGEPARFYRVVEP